MSNNPPLSPGIRGWLILVAVLVVVAPGNFIAHDVLLEREFNFPSVRAFCDRSSPVYDARWPTFVFTETTGFRIVGTVTMLVLWPLLVLKHRFFPTAFVAIAVTLACLLAVRAVLAAAIGTVAAHHRSSLYGQTAFWLPVVLALAVYVIRSRRAQITFVYKLVPYPMFPFFNRVSKATE